MSGWVQVPDLDDAPDAEVIAWTGSWACAECGAQVLPPREPVNAPVFEFRVAFRRGGAGLEQRILCVPCSGLAAS